MTSAEMRALASEVKLPRPPGMLRRFLSAHPRLVDGTIVGFYLFGAALMLLVDALTVSTNVEQLAETAVLPEGRADQWLGLPASLTFPMVLLTVLRVAMVAIALAFRRRFPLMGLALVALALVADSGSVGLANTVALWFLLYAVPVYRSVAAGWVGFGISLVVTGLTVITDALGWTLVDEGSTDVQLSLGETMGAAVFSALWLLAILMIGINLGNRRRYLGALIDHAHRLARERDQLAQLAVAEERSRIAREMHDIVAHSVSVMIALSEGAAQAAAVAPKEAGDAMRRSAETGRSALGEMRRLLGALSDPAEGSADRVPQPGLADLPTLVDTFVEAGLKVTIDVSGSTSGDRGQELAIYRIAQEGLTNTLRYAGTGARAHVRVTGTSDVTEIEVRDYGPVSAVLGPVAGIGSGRGLRGLSERVRMFGGDIDAGPAQGGGWRLSARLPVSADARVGSAAAKTGGGEPERGGRESDGPGKDEPESDRFEGDRRRQDAHEREDDA